MTQLHLVGTVLLWCAAVIGSLAIIAWLLTVGEWLVDRAVKSLRVFKTVIDFAIHHREFKAWLKTKEPK